MMTPSRLILDQTQPVYASDSVATGHCKAEDVFNEYLDSWKALVEKRSFLKDFLENHTISDFSREDIYCLEKILNRAFILHGESEFVKGEAYFESFTIVLPTVNETRGQKYKKSYSHSYLLGSTTSRSFYISYGLFSDRSKPVPDRYRISNFYLDNGNVKKSLESFNRRGFWFNAFAENFVAIFKAILRTFNRESGKDVSKRKQSFVKNVFNLLFQESLAALSFDRIENDFAEYFKRFHGDTLDLFDPNLLQLVVKQRYDRFLNDPKLVLEETQLKPVVDARHTSAVLTGRKGDPQRDFFEVILGKPLDTPYAYEMILNDPNKEDLLQDILRSQFALNYLGNLYFSASYLIENRNNPQKKTLTLLQYDEDALPRLKAREMFHQLYPDLVIYLTMNFGRL